MRILILTTILYKKHEKNTRGKRFLYFICIGFLHKNTSYFKTKQKVTVCFCQSVMKKFKTLIFDQNKKDTLLRGCGSGCWSGSDPNEKKLQYFIVTLVIKYCMKSFFSKKFWILMFITNPDPMLLKIRIRNQSLSEYESATLLYCTVQDA